MSALIPKEEIRISDENKAVLPVETVEAAINEYQEEKSGSGNRLTRIVYSIINTLADKANIIGGVGSAMGIALYSLNQDGAGYAAFGISVLLAGTGNLLRVAMLPGEKLKDSLKQSSTWSKENAQKKSVEQLKKAL